MLRTRQPIFKFCTAALFLALLPCGWASGDDINQLQSKIYSAIEKVKPAVVAISDRGAIFSGVIISKKGYIITAGHAVRPNRRYGVTLADGRKFTTRGLGSNLRIDMAMLKINSDTDLPFAEMGDSATLVRNQPCVGISHPGIYNSNRGPVIRYGRILQPVTRNEGMIKSTAKMEPGDSGGPLIDLEGKVIGIHSNIRRDEEANYDVPVVSFLKHWDELQEPEIFYINGLPSLPKLGFRGLDSDKGVKILKVYKDGQAEKNGLKVDDLVTSVAGTRVSKARHINNRMIDLRASGTAEIFVNVERDGNSKAVRFRLREKDQTSPKVFSEFSNLSERYSKLESKLDDSIFVVRSKVNSKRQAVLATRVKRSANGNLISKSSRVGTDPIVTLPNGVQVKAKIIARDSKNDLVLLNASLPGAGGIDLSNVLGDMEEKPGKFLLAPHPNSIGKVSIWGSKYFNVAQSKGFLGVEVDMRNNKVIFSRVLQGAARDAGIESGDHIVRLDEKDMLKRNDVSNYLSGKPASTKVIATIKRDDKEITKTIRLGNRFENTGHVADQLVGGRSLRRDGFSLAISHDADLRPEDCGGPVFDLNGQFLGVNISRTSRTRSYVVPRTIVKKFIDNPAAAQSSNN